MRLSLGCIADDYTGASDLANTLTRQGIDQRAMSESETREWLSLL